MASKRTFALRSKVVVGFMLVLSALVVATYISYESFTILQQASNIISQPNLKIERIDSILVAVTKTENTLQEYTVAQSTDKTTKLEAYDQQVAKVERIIESLESETQREESALDSVLSLIKDKLVSLEDFKEIEQQRNEFDFYDRALIELENKVSSIAAQQEVPHFLEDTSRQKAFPRISVPEWLTRRSKREEQLLLDTEENSSVTLAPDSVRQFLQEVRNDQKRRQNQANQRELAYLQNNAQVMGSIYDLVGQLKKQEQARSQERVAEARTAMNDAIIRIAMILIVAFLSTIVIVYLILSDITRSDFYRSKLLAAKSRAERLARVKEDFLANMSHEIRTPLTAILGFTEQLKFSELDSQQKQHVNALDSSSQHLLALVNDILDFSKIEAGKINFESEPFDVIQIIREVKHDLQLMANKKEIDLRYSIKGEDHRYVMGDPFRLKQVLYNLVSNAIKFTHRGEVLISAQMNALSNQRTDLRLEIIDTGIGIPKEKQASIFDAFHQSDVSTTRKYGGTGLGLAICKRLIEGQNGRFEIESEEGSGSVFRVTLNYGTAPMLDSEQVSVEDGGLPEEFYVDGEALVIDDNPLNGTLLELALKGRGVNTTVCHSGKEGIAAAEDQVFDIIFCDLHMPEMDGAQVIHALNENPLVIAYNTPIIAFTANVQTEDRKRYEKIGVKDFLLKPFNQTQLDGLLRKHWPDLEFDVDEHSSDEPDATTTSAAFSLEQVRQFTGDDNEALVSYLDTFVETAKQSRLSMETALTEQSTKDISFHAHKLVSQVELLKSEPLTSHLKYLEQAAHESSWNQEYEKKAKEAISLITELTEAIQTKLQELIPATAITRNYSKL